MEALPSAERQLDVDGILYGLNRPQRDAVTSEAAVLQILAPPGSGKTRTLTSRVAWMLAQGMNPSNIIVATFTVKASKEMKERIGKMIGGGLESRLILGTFHSIARRYLAKYGHLIGIPKGFGIADTSDTKTILSRLIKRNNYSTIDGNDAGNLRSRISNLKAKMQTVDQYLAAQKKSAHNDEFGKIYQQYEQELKNSNLLDYDDLLLRCLDLLREHPLCVSNIEAVLIDEFQDTNLVQFDLMCLLASRRNKITIVGDPDQSIYGFRAAEIGNLSTMQQVYPETVVINLEENYRSAAAILQCALEVIEQDKARPQKGITPTHEIGKSPVLRQLPSPDAEGKWIVQEVIRLRALTGNLFKFDDFAILIRSASLARAIETQMNNSGIPYRLIAGTKFFERAEVKPILDYLRVVMDPNNSEALAKIVNVPPRRLGAKSIEGLVAEAHKRGMSIWNLIRKGVRGDLKFEAKISKEGERSLCEFMKVITDTQNVLNAAKNQESQNIAPVIEFLLEKIKYKAFVEGRQRPDEERWQHVEELVSQATEFCNNLAAGIDEAELPDTDAVGSSVEESKLTIALGKFLANAALATVKEGPETNEEENGEGVLTISTIHNAKGLEWPVVFVPGCYEGSIPHSRAEDTDEERRLLYVAMTRAQALLYLSYPYELRDRKSGEKQDSNLCQFLSEDKIKPMLTSVGPLITPQVIKSLSIIMSRDCPSHEKVQETTIAAQLERHDDWVPSDIPQNSEMFTERDFADDDGYNFKRAPLSRGQSWSGGNQSWKQNSTATSIYNTTNGASTHRTTMSSFTAQSTTMQGFKSASSHMHNLTTSKLECEADIRKRSLMKRKSDGITEDNHAGKTAQSKIAKQKVEQPTKGKKSKEAGNSIMNYFQKPAASLPLPSQPPKPLKPTAGNSVVDRKEKGGTPKYIYLSSSPERPPPKRDIVTQNHQLQQQMRENPPVSKFTSVSAMVSASSSSYMAPTTLSRMTDSSTTTVPSSSSSSTSSGPRKTLGMRRTMTGWNDRHGTNKRA
ncbi:hypothetical protein ABW19_dt0201020 [Dactylella cylindrospora]|nr:hypothetical protein ABW19_dt0201020 [Dactylella cylindrospora]